MTRDIVGLATLALAVCVGPARPAAGQGAGASARAAFEQLKSLAGTWQGPASHDTTGQEATVVYRVASGGSVVQETLFPGTPHEMISMYHLADGNLVMTHYCAMGNQPRMKLDTAASTPQRLVFAFDGGTNLDPAKDGHVHSGVLELRGDTVRADWAVWSSGKEAGHNVFELRRAK
ncbi:MAG TPA: hypothetical protein VEQ10_06805 [Vicinamibacteria bacterium]|nr:hypothetical protein [Vicinamibacteria bacterium]